jgi:uncharacterized protein DUF5681
VTFLNAWNAEMNDDESSSKRTKQLDPPTGEYKVGFRHPPREHQFKAGNNANPRGRRKGTRNNKLVIKDVLFELINVREGGEPKRMSVLEAILKKLTRKALNGDNKAALAVIGIAQREGFLTPEQEQEVEEFLPETDKAILEDYKARLASPPSLPAEENHIPPQPKSQQDTPAAEDLQPRRPITRRANRT